MYVSVSMKIVESTRSTHVFRVLLYLLCCTVGICFGQIGYWPEVRITPGVVRGKRLRTALGKEFYGFMGIPYASPPIGQLRFKVRFRFVIKNGALRLN